MIGSKGCSRSFVKLDRADYLSGARPLEAAAQSTSTGEEIKRTKTSSGAELRRLTFLAALGRIRHGDS
jgi:hypothetical protein